VEAFKVSVTAAAVAAFLEEWAPLSTQASYDNSGFQCGDPQVSVSGILTCLDFTPQVLSEAQQAGCNLVIAHHPPIFRKLPSVTTATPAGRLLIETIKAGITVYALHTPADFAENGVSYVLASQLDIHDAELLAPDKDGLTGAGVIGQLHVPMSPHDFLAHVRQKLDQPSLRYSGNAPYIHRVAVCGGSGADLAGIAARKGAQAYVTSDVKYHQFFVDASDFLFVDAGHYETETAFVQVLARRLSEKFAPLNVISTRVCTNPVRFSITRSEPTTV
jgi:dinuclear metal center YbgI/SA1388 family protein